MAAEHQRDIAFFIVFGHFLPQKVRICRVIATRSHDDLAEAICFRFVASAEGQ
jgi:hypothetical protein